MLVLLSSSHLLSVKDIQEPLSYLLYRSILFLSVYIPYHVLQSTTERFPDSHLADRVGHGHMVICCQFKVGFNIDVRKGMLSLHYLFFYRYMQFKL